MVKGILFGYLLLYTGVPVVTPAAITVEEGDTVTLTCTAEGVPAPQIMWYRGPNQITEATLSRATLTTTTLTISDIRLSDDDYYRCRAVFAQGETNSKAILDVLCKLMSIIIEDAIIMPRCACASEVYGSVFVCVCVCVSV